MLWFFNPYSFNKKLFEAWDQYMNLVRDPNDWVCMRDGDTMFMLPDWGHQIKHYIEKYPDTGLFTCYASRCHYQPQIRLGTDTESTDLLYHRSHAQKIYDELYGKVKEMDRRIAGHLIVMKKSTWTLIRNDVEYTSRSKNILGIDTKISNAILKKEMKIRLMRGIYLLHYLRMFEGYNYTKHLE